ncbi:MAG: lytic murein transglycosylase [Gammaproteobacteria bacterium]|nr:lytic murein transglycosylase [Gammaproteobacteria bacterium]
MRTGPLLLVIALLAALPAAAADFDDAAQLPALLAHLRDDDGFSAGELVRVRQALAQAQALPQVVSRAENAKEKTLTWDDYEPIHVNPANVRNGVAFMTAQQAWLERAEADYGVAPAVIAALLGVETKYGAYTGHYRVIDALATQAFEHPTRGDFFLHELEDFFVLSRDHGLDPLMPKGSYAGATGMVQFMPSSVLRFALDYDGDGSIDLNSPADAIGSVANYLANHDPQRAWQRGLPLIVPASVDGDPPTTFPRNQTIPDQTVASLTAAGIRPQPELPGNLIAGWIALDAADGVRNFVALQNFYAVMSYNPHVFYAMSVAELAQRLTQAEAQR